MGIKTVRELILRLRDTGVTEAEKHVKSFTGATDSAKSAWTGLGGTISKVSKVLALGVAADAVVKALGAKAIISAGRDLDTYRQRLSAVLGDAEKGARRLAQLQKISSPFDLGDLVEANAQLELFEINGEAALDTIGNASAALGRKASEGANALTQAMLGNMRGVREFGITMQDIQRELGFEPDTQTIKGQRATVEAILAIWQREFPEGMQDAQQTYSGILGGMGDELFKFKAKIAEGGFFDTIKDDLADVLQAVQHFDEQGGFDAISIGFNSAWLEVHRLFFEPFFGALDETPVNVAVMAARTEKIVLSMTATLSEQVSILRLGMSGLAGMGEFMKSAFTFDVAGAAKWQHYLEVTLQGEGAKAQLRVAGLRGRVSELDEALRMLGETGGVVTPEIQELLGYTSDAWTKLMDTFVGPPEPSVENLEAFRGKVTKTAAEIADEWKRAMSIVPQIGLDPARFSLGEGLLSGARDAGEDYGAEFGRGISLGVADVAAVDMSTIGIDPSEVESRLGDVTALYADHFAKLSEMQALWDADVKQQQFELAEIRAEFLQGDLDLTAEYYAGLGEMEGLSVEERLAYEAGYLTEKILLYAAARDAAQEMFASISGYAQTYAIKSMNIGRVTNALLIRGVGEYGKAVIGVLTQESKMKALKELAESIASAASGNFGAAAKHALAAAKFGAIVGAGAIGQAVIEREVSERENRIMGLGDEGAISGGGGPAGRFKSSQTVRQGAVVNNFYISIVHNISGDYVVQDEKTDAVLSQELLDSNLVVTRG
jgi:hypothetical protein